MTFSWKFQASHGRFNAGLQLKYCNIVLAKFQKYLMILHSEIFQLLVILLISSDDLTFRRALMVSRKITWITQSVSYVKWAKERVKDNSLCRNELKMENNVLRVSLYLHIKQVLMYNRELIWNFINKPCQIRISLSDTADDGRMYLTNHLVPQCLHTST